MNPYKYFNIGGDYEILQLKNYLSLFVKSKYYVITPI